MIGVRLEGGCPKVKRDLPEPLPAPGEALSRVRCAGVCGTDPALLGGYADLFSLFQPVVGAPVRDAATVASASAGALSLESAIERSPGVKGRDGNDQCDDQVFHRFLLEPEQGTDLEYRDGG
jgi:hypothetical protein